MEHNYPLKNLTTWKIGGPAEYVCWPESAEELVAAVREALSQGQDFRIIGRGSNLLAPDRGLAGITVVTTELRRILWGEHSVWVEAGYSLAKLAREAGERGWSGLEFAGGIPGTVGGAVVMNAGAYGEDMAGGIKNVKVWCDGEVRLLNRERLKFGYRTSSFQDESVCGVEAALSVDPPTAPEPAAGPPGKGGKLSLRPLVLAAELSFGPGERERILARMSEGLRKRAAAQPLAEANAGSVFRNPPGDYAARLIEQSGWKGKRCGGAKVSEKHSNFIVNTGEATATDVLCLIEDIRADVWQKFGIRLETEVRYLGAEGGRR
ncbi:UDP-N-acetylmuramate dehydrogenase [Acididesulfobacillus acetoxydans]|uniref:UDP-N-acetylenolpyruvoylglucosamine reductase n=1 Tax=Acididesulfobacillus acetoxydans TaxID=1561005 RepID=A0A8S0XCW5_9FIRM|nr:UDP-N-acetylmuramate dehydrogenase [Acididesulfobacillus acetoxydans]CEJ05767.1 UDP-N-acetylenolpyruvoylglucosamine reductase [Acididesulfobacillus acetoxydans]